MSEKFTPKCPKCNAVFSVPPKNWDCPKCNVKTWQPDETVTTCQICEEAPVGKFSRHHCRQCGRVACTNCSMNTIIIPEWSPTEKQRVCKMCAVPKVAPTKTGFLFKLGQRNPFFKEKFQSRYFELRGTTLMYAKDRDAPTFGHVDIAGGKVVDVAMHPHAFCLIGPRLQRGYIFRAENDDDKRSWMEAIERELNGVIQDEEESTQDVIYGGAQNSKTVSVADFDLITVLGLGSFGRVMKVRDKSNGRIYAMKVLDKQQIVAHKMITHTQAEKSILAEMQHPFVVKLHYAFQTKRHLVLVMDFLCGGELFFHLQRNKRFSESRARFYAAEIGTALEYLHSKNIIYRDLKPENLVLDRDGHVVLTDFGLAKREVHDVTHTFCGTPEYMAPELIEKKGHTLSVDWWSLGIFLYEMIAGLPPFYSQNVAEMYDAILHKPLTFPAQFTSDLRSLLSRLLERNPAKRMCTGEEFRAHPFFRSIDFAKLLRREVTPEFVPDVAGNDLRYFDSHFLRESTKVEQLTAPLDPRDPTSRRFEGFDFGPSVAAPPAVARDEPQSPPFADI